MAKNCLFCKADVAKILTISGLFFSDFGSAFTKGLLVAPKALLIRPKALLVGFIPLLVRPMSLLIFPMSLLVFRKRAIGKNVGGRGNDGFYVLRGRKWRFFASGRGYRRCERDGGRGAGGIMCGASGVYKLSQESRVAKRSRGR